MKLILKLAASIFALACCAPSFATTLNFEYTANSSHSFVPVSGDFGVDMFVGDSANLVLKTAPNKAFQTNNDFIWAILGFTQEGNRRATYSYSFLLDGMQVHSGTKVEDTAAIHMGPGLYTGFTGLFDEYRWSATLEGSSAYGNTTDNIMAGSSVGNHGMTSAQIVDALDPTPAEVPEPASLALVAAGLLGLALRRNRT